jgi:hypothetical protein
MERFVIVGLLLVSSGCETNRTAGAAAVYVPTLAVLMVHQQIRADLDRVAEHASSDQPIVLGADYYSPIYVERPNPRLGEPYCFDDVPVCVRDREVTPRARVLCSWEGTPRCAGPRVACPRDSFAYCAENRARSEEVRP